MTKPYAFVLAVGLGLGVLTAGYYLLRPKPADTATPLALDTSLTPGITPEAPKATPEAPTLPEAPAPAASEPAPLVSPATAPAAATQPEPAPVAVATPAPTTQPMPAKTYTIKSGDTFTAIAHALYGQESRWTEIAQANPTVDPSRLRIGQVIKLPESATVSASSIPKTPPAIVPGARTTETTSATPTTYIVKEGDTLAGIAQQVCGDANKWPALYRANKPQIGANPNKLHIGMQLTIPPAATPPAAEHP